MNWHIEETTYGELEVGMKMIIWTEPKTEKPSFRVIESIERGKVSTTIVSHDENGEDYGTSKFNNNTDKVSILVIE